MVSFLKGRRKTDDAVVAVDSSGAHITVALETLVARAETALEQLRAMSGVLDRTPEIDVLRERCEAAERQVAGMEEMMARVSQAEGQLQRVTQSSEQLDQIQVRMGELGGKVEAAIALRDHAEKFLSLEGPLNAARGDADQVRAQLNELGEQVTRMRAQHDDALTAHRQTTSRLEAIDQEHQAATGRLEETWSAGCRSSSARWTRSTRRPPAIPDVQHQLAVLKSLADQLAQKTTSLEQQREAVDRAASQISKLTVMDRELDAWLRRQEEQIRRFGPIEAKITDVQALQAKVMAPRPRSCRPPSRRPRRRSRRARQALTDLREQMRKSSEGFELENRGLHAVSERVGDLRDAVKECEARFAVLDAASQGAAAVQAQVRGVGEQASRALAGAGAALTEEARRIGVDAAGRRAARDARRRHGGADAADRGAQARSSTRPCGSSPRSRARTR